jgi:hypothetical protein
LDWNFAEGTVKVNRFANIPAEIIDNLLYLCTKPRATVQRWARLHQATAPSH